MRKINESGPGTARKSKSVLKPEPEPPDNLSQFWNRTRNRQIIWVSSRTGTGRNMDPLQQCRISDQSQHAVVLWYPIFKLSDQIFWPESFYKGLFWTVWSEFLTRANVQQPSCIQSWCSLIKNSDQSSCLEAYLKLSGQNFWPDFPDVRKPAARAVLKTPWSLFY